MSNEYKLARFKRDGRIVWAYLLRVSDTSTVEAPCDYTTSQTAEKAYQMGLQEGASSQEER